ncbi:MAG: hypothetical protein DRI44_03435 [Chlamydiae bacterium]|nr:MAG: hypothetical protein DRI44_03435 [Chlamydiota bacterium]
MLIVMRKNNLNNIEPHKINRRRNMTIVTLCAVFGVAGGTCISNNVLSLVAIKLGAGDIYLGLLAAAFTAPLVLGIFSMKAIEKHGKLKILIPWTAASTILVMLYMLIPKIAQQYRPVYVLSSLFVIQILINTCAAIGNTAWFPLLQDTTPTRLTGRFFARLRTSWQTASIITVIVISFFLGKNSEWWKFEIIFAAAFILLTIKFLLLLRIQEKPLAVRHISDKTIIGRFKEVFQIKQLRYCIIYLACYSFLAAAPEPFKIKMLKQLHYSSGFILAAISMFGVGAILSLRFWGKLADKFGNRAIFSISHIGMIVTTILWLIIDNNIFSEIMTFILYFSFGIFHSGNGIAQTRYVLHSVPDSKQNYINIINFTTFFFISIAPIITGVFLTMTQNVSFSSGALNLNNYHLMFIIIGTLFIVPHILRRNLRAAKESSTSNVVAFVMRPLRNIFGPFKRINRK